MLALVMVICMTPGFALAQDAPALDFIEMSNTADGVGNSLQIAAEPEDDYDYKLYIPDFQESVLSNATYAKAKAVDPNQKVWVCTTASLGGFGIVAAKMQEISADDWTSFKCSSRTDKTIQIYVGSDAPTIKKEGKIQSFDFPESGTAYNVKITLVPTLNGLSIQNNNTLTPDYTWENKEYTAYVSDTLTSVTFNSVKFSTTQSINLQ